MNGVISKYVEDAVILLGLYKCSSGHSVHITHWEMACSVSRHHLWVVPEKENGRKEASDIITSQK